MLNSSHWWLHCSPATQREMLRQPLLRGRWMEVTLTHRKKTSPSEILLLNLGVLCQLRAMFALFPPRMQKRHWSKKCASFAIVMKSARLNYRFLSKSKFQISAGLANGIIMMNWAEEGISSFLSPTSMWQHPAIWTRNSNCHSLQQKIRGSGLFWNSIAEVWFISLEELLAENSGSYFTINTLTLYKSVFNAPSAAAQAQGRAAPEAALHPWSLWVALAHGTKSWWETWTLFRSTRKTHQCWLLTNCPGVRENPARTLFLITFSSRR